MLCNALIRTMPDQPKVDVDVDVVVRGFYVEIKGVAFNAGRGVENAHLYLASRAVYPNRQGPGFGRMLLIYGLQRVDADGMPAYLEATGLRSRAFYGRHGFRPLGAGISRTRGGPETYPMRRPPQGSIWPGP